MGRLISWLGTLLIVVSVVGFAYLWLAPDAEPPWVNRPVPVTNVGRLIQPGVAGGSVVRLAPAAEASLGPAVGAAAAAPISTPRAGDPAPTSGLSGSVDGASISTHRPINVIAIPSIDLTSDVVVAPLLERNGALTWDVPKFKAGWADGTAGAGEKGNAVLLGHVQSRSSGNVFAKLESVKVGDEIIIASDLERLTYRVVQTAVVERTDTSMLQSTDGPSVTLVTCTGNWDPFLWEYRQRFVVHAELMR